MRLMVAKIINNQVGATPFTSSLLTGCTKRGAMVPGLLLVVIQVPLTLIKQDYATTLTKSLCKSIFSGFQYSIFILGLKPIAFSISSFITN